MSLQVDEEAKEFLIQQGSIELRRATAAAAIQRYVEDALAEEVLRGRFAEGAAVRIRKAEGASLLFEGAEAVEATP